MYSVDTVQVAIQLYTQAAATDEYVCLQHTYIPMYIRIYGNIAFMILFAVYLYGTYNQRVTIAQLSV